MNKQHATLSASSFGGKVMKRKGAVLAGALASILSFSTGYAITFEIATEKSTISNKAEEGAGTVLKLWFKDDAGNMTSLGADSTLTIDSTVDTVIADFSTTMAMGTMSTTLTIGGTSKPELHLPAAGLGQTTLKATATAGTTSLTSDEIPLSVVEDYMAASFTDSADGTNVGKYVNISVTNGSAPLVADTTATVTHVVDGKVIEIVPSALVANNSGTLTLAFSEPTGNLTTGEHYVIKSEGLGDALIMGAGDATKADIVIPTMPAMTGNSDVTGGISKQDNTFVSLFDGNASVSVNDSLNLLMAIKPKAEHVGQKADKILVPAYVDVFNVFGLPPEMLLAWSLAEDRTTFVTWDWDQSLTPDDTSDDQFNAYQKGKTLTDSEAFHIWSGPLPIPGVFFFFAGYQLTDNPDVIVFNDQQIGMVVINPAAE